MVRKSDVKDALKEGFFGIPPSQPKETVQDNEEPLKVTINLPKDTLDTIDKMVKTTMVGSRGRLIQLLIDDVWTLQGEYNVIEASIKQYSEKTMNDPQFIATVTFGLVGILRRLARYYGKDILKTR